MNCIESFRKNYLIVIILDLGIQVISTECGPLGHTQAQRGVRILLSIWEVALPLGTNGLLSVGMVDRSGYSVVGSTDMGLIPHLAGSTPSFV